MEPRRYRKKPVVIEAMQWDGTAPSATGIIDWALAESGAITYRCVDTQGCMGDANSPHVLSIQTLEGLLTGSPGDYIIRGVQGKFYPCKPAIFEATYEVA